MRNISFMAGADISFEEEKDEYLLKIRGPLTLSTLPFQLDISPSQPALPLIIDFSDLSKIDTSGANALLIEVERRGFSQDKITLRNLKEEDEKILKLVLERRETESKIEEKKQLTVSSLIAALGKTLTEVGETIREYVALFGEVIYTFFSYSLNPGKVRVRELFSQIDQAGIRAIPVITLVTFLIGIVVAYLLAMQAEKFGASIFVIDGVAIAMCREMSPILVAIIVAGRSGSAFTAQIGAMKLTEEIDAIKSIGLNYFDVLIFPRIAALILVMPLLVFVGDLVGIFGGQLITDSYLGLSSVTFFDRLEQVLATKHIVVGIIKAPVFAVIIGLCACHVGLNSKKDARSVGLSTTKTVVQSIVWVILLNAAFAVIFAELGI